MISRRAFGFWSVLCLGVALLGTTHLSLADGPAPVSAMSSASLTEQEFGATDTAVSVVMRTDSAGVRPLVSSADSLQAVRDSVEKRQLPRRALPLSQQVMFAAGFMAFIALMIASMQNLNPQ